MEDTIVECAEPRVPQILVAFSEMEETEPVRAAIAELGVDSVMVEDAAEAVRLLCAAPTRFAAVVAGERVGRWSGMTLCGVARDAGIRVPILLVTGADCRSSAMRAVRLQASVMWKPVPPRRIARTLLAMLPRRPCGGAVRRLTAVATGTRVLPNCGRDLDRWHRSRRLW